MMIDTDLGGLAHNTSIEQHHDMSPGNRSLGRRMGVVHEEEYYNEDAANKSSWSRNKKSNRGDGSVGAKSPRSKVSS